MKKKYALITGASGEIGSNIAKLLGEKNFNLILQYNKNRAKLDQVIEILSKKNIDIYTIEADLSRFNNISKMFDEIEQLEVEPNILINSAGIGHYGLIQDVSLEDWERVININLMSAFFCSQRILPYMIKHKYGRIINISSIWGNIGAANEVLYSTAKGGLNTFTKALARELAPSRITVNAIAPGIVVSNMISNFSKEELDELLQEMPINRFVKPEEIANTVYHLLDDNSAALTGQIITIDGSWT